MHLPVLGTEPWASWLLALILIKGSRGPCPTPTLSHPSVGVPQLPANLLINSPLDLCLLGVCWVLTCWSPPSSPVTNRWSFPECQPQGGGAPEPSRPCSCMMRNMNPQQAQVDEPRPHPGSKGHREAGSWWGMPRRHPLWAHRWPRCGAMSPC